MLRSPKAEPGTKVIVLRGEWLDEKQLNLALKGISERTWLALVQLAEMERLDLMEAAKNSAWENNSLAMSLHVGGHNALLKYLDNVDLRRSLPEI